MAVTNVIKAISKKLLANRRNYGGKRSLKTIKYIVIHYTANDGDHDESNAKYFHNNVVKASAHYFVDDDSYTQSVPDDYVAYSVGGKKLASCKDGAAKYFGICTNANSINIELCDTAKDGKVYPSKATIENALALTKTLMKKYGIPADRVIRHYDVTGKLCPAYWCGSAAKDALWKSEFHDRLTEASEPNAQKVDAAKSFDKKLAKVYKANCNCRLWTGPTGSAICKIAPKETVRCFGYYTDRNGKRYLAVQYKGKNGFVLATNFD